MRKINKLFILIIIIILTTLCVGFVGCDKEDDDSTDIYNDTNVGEGKYINVTSNISDDCLCELSWNYANESKVLKTQIIISSSFGEESFDYYPTTDSDKHTWNYQMQEDIVYNFTFTSYLISESDSEPITDAILNFSRMKLSNSKEYSFSRVEIETENSILPTCDYVSTPEDCWGAGIRNAKYVQSKISIYDKENTLVYSSYANGEDYDGAKIKLRGNTSAYRDKKPLKIKLSSKADLLSSFIDGRTDKNYKNKNWLLLTNGSELNQIVGSSVAESVGLSYVPEYEYVYLIVNGDFMGTYILTESVSQGNGEGDKQSRVCVSDSGFIIENDAYWWNEDLYFETPFTEDYPTKFTFKYPDSDDINESSEEYLYIKNYVCEFENALKRGKDYTEYIDVDSFAKWILAHDYLSTLDAAGSNIYFYKFDSTDESKLCMGPLWDFDSIYDTGLESRANIHNASKMFDYLFKDKYFSQIYKNLFIQTKDSVVQNISKRTSKYQGTDYDKLIDLDVLRWNKNYSHLNEQINDTIEWMNQHITWLEEEIE